MKLRFRVGRKEGSKQARKNGDIEALADAMRALKNYPKKQDTFVLGRSSAYLLYVLKLEFGIISNSSRLKKKLYWSKLSCLTNKKFIFSVKSKHKIFKIQIWHISKSVDELPMTYCKIEEIFPCGPDRPNGPKLQIHVRNLAQDPCVATLLYYNFRLKTY